MTQTWTTPLAGNLTQGGVSTPTATVICQYYPDAEPSEFLAGLDVCSQALQTLTPPKIIPKLEPWLSLATALAAVQPGDMDDTLLLSLAPYAPELQGALNDALMQRSNALTAKTVIAAAKKRRAKSDEYLQHLTELGYSFRLNDLNDLLEVNGKPITDPLAAQIRAQMRDRGFDYVNVMEDVYLSHAYQCRYNPILEYLDQLTWDGQPHISRLAAHFTDRDNVFPQWLRAWLIGAVAKARKSEQNPMLVLDGEQGLGKSHFVEWLGGVLPGYCVEHSIDPEDKDAFIRLCSVFVWQVSEFGATIRRADREALKSFITLRTVRVRRPYGRYDIIKPAVASFIGTVNNEAGLLSDPTGNRRFLIACITGIDWGYALSIEPHQVWAEANAAYLAGESWKLSPTAKAQSVAINERYEIEEPIEGLLLKYFRVDPADTHTWTATVDILTTLEANGLRGGSTKQNAMALAGVATKLNLAKAKGYTKNGQRVWGYMGVDSI